MTTQTSTSAAQSGIQQTHLWRNAFVDLSREHGFETMRVDGKLPADLLGTLYRTGPSLFSAQGRSYGHWFDGDGAVSAVRFTGGRAEGAVKLVQSQGLLAERASGRALYSGYGTRAPGNVLTRLGKKAKNAGNTNVIVWQDRLYALWAGGLPTELSTRDLTTLGERDFDGVLTSAFSAHPHRVPARKCSYNFDIVFKGPPRLDIYAMPDDGPAKLLTRVRLRASTMIHDFVVTSKHLVFFAPPLRLSVPKILLGLGSYSECLNWKGEEGTDVIVVPLDAPDEHTIFNVEAFFQWHFANAFERGGDEIVVDSVDTPDFSSNAWLGKLPLGVPEASYNGNLTRNVINLRTKTLKRTRISPVSTEFPRISSQVIGLPYRYTYTAAHSGGDAARGLFDRVARFDVESGDLQSVALGDAQYPSEPVFVRKADAKDADEGYLLTLVYDGLAHESHVAVLDAQRLTDGPLARAYFGHHLPFTFHGNWVRASAT